MAAHPPHLTPPKIKESAPDPSGNLLWIFFAAILNVTALLLLFAIFRDTGDTATYMANSNRTLIKSIEEVREQNDKILTELKKLKKANGLPASEPSTAP